MTALAPVPSTACHAHWLQYPFLEGVVGAIFAVDGIDAVLPCRVNEPLG